MRRRAGRWSRYVAGATRQLRSVYAGIRVLRPRRKDGRNSVIAWPFGRVRIAARFSKRAGYKRMVRPGARAPGRCVYCNRRLAYFDLYAPGLCSSCDGEAVAQLLFEAAEGYGEEGYW